MGAAASFYAHTAFATLDTLDATTAQAEAPDETPPPPPTPALPEPRQPPRIGDSALAPAGTPQRLYPAVVIGEPSAGTVEVAFEDRDRATVPVEALRPIPDRPSVRAYAERYGWDEPVELLCQTFREALGVAVGGGA